MNEWMNGLFDEFDEFSFVILVILKNYFIKITIIRIVIKNVIFYDNR